MCRRVPIRRKIRVCFCAMYYLNKIVAAIVNPIVMTLVLAMVGMVLGARGRKRLALGFVGSGIFWLWLWSTPMMCRWIGMGLESEWPMVLAEEAPKANAIVVLGGGMAANTNVYTYAEMCGGADRVWHAARLWKAGKAPIVIASGTGERVTTVPLLKDLGVAEAAIVVEDKARNTEENAKFVESVLLEKSGGVESGGVESGGVESGGVESGGVESGGVEKFDSPTHPLKNSSTPPFPHSPTSRPKVLLVTSAWHMRRSVLMFKKYAPDLEIIPAATDYEASVRMGGNFGVADLLPSADCLSANSAYFKELIGYWGYRLFR